jgi:hypothetical protein
MSGRGRRASFICPLVSGSREVDYHLAIAELMVGHGMHDSTDLIPRSCDDPGVHTDVCTEDMKPWPPNWTVPQP